MKENSPHPLMHRTESIDYGVVIEGEMTLVSMTAKCSSSGFGGHQRGTNHAWANRSGRMCRMLFVLVAGTYDPRSQEPGRPIGLPHRQYRHEYCSQEVDMKFATYHDGTRDGQLWVVSRDLNRAIPATGIATSLLEAVETGRRVAPKLAALYDRLNSFEEPFATRFEPERCLAPLPRAPQWLDASAFLNHGG